MIEGLLNEIMKATQTKAFNFDLNETVTRAQNFLSEGAYFAFIATDVHNQQDIGFITLCESHALYAGGDFGIIQECYVHPNFRAQGVGNLLLKHAKHFAIHKNWKRMEVTTPPLPAFSRSLKFYEKAGFTITGGAKLKLPL